MHLVLVMARHHTQFRESARHTQKRIVGVPLFPGQAPRSLALMFFVAGLLFLLGGLIQINPIWQWGPFEPWLGTNGAQPDWYLGWLIGALRLMPGFDVTVGHFTLIPNPFWGGVLFPLVVLGVALAVPWAERRFTGDRGVHNLADRPRDAPRRTAFGVAFLSWVFLIFAFGAADRIFVAVGPELQRAAVRVPRGDLGGAGGALRRDPPLVPRAAGRRAGGGDPRARGGGDQAPSGWVRAQCSSSAWTKAWGRLPRIWRWTTSNSSESSPAGPHAARLRSNQRAARTASPCWA